MRIDDHAYRKDLAYPDRLRTGRFHGYGRLSRNASAIRTARQIRAILIHTTNSPHGNTHWEPEAEYLRDAEAVSAHYVVSSHDDTVVQSLPDALIAWHAGDCADSEYENAASIGIEIAWTTGKGALPAQAIVNVTDLVLFLLRRFPHIRKIDTHRRQAVPAGRKSDPAGWSNAAFDRWRTDVLARAFPPAPPPAIPDAPTAPPLASARYRVITPAPWVRSLPTTGKESRKLGELRLDTEVEGQYRLGEILTRTVRGKRVTSEDWLLFRYRGQDGYIWAGQLERIP